jgi:hypothetical protein
MSNLSEVVGEDVNLSEVADSAPEPVAHEAPVDPPAPDVPAEPEAPKTVPLAALHEERQRRKELAAELAQARQATLDLERRVEARLAALTKPKEPEAPAWDENPAEHLRHQLSQVTQQTQATQAQIEQWQQAQQRQAMVQQLATRVNAAESEFMAQAPDYNDAVTFLRDRRVAELTVLGLEETAARTQSARELSEAALYFAQQGRNAAEIAYSLAKAKGYTPRNQHPTDQQKFETQAKGATARSLGSGGPAKNNLTAAQLLAMSDDEFAEATSGNKWQKLVG